MDKVDNPASDIPIMRFLISTLVSNVPFALPPFFVFFCRSVPDLSPLFRDDSLLCWGSQDDWLFSFELHVFELSDPMITIVCSGLGMPDCKRWCCCWIWCSTDSRCWSRLWWWDWVFCWCDSSCSRVCTCACTCCWACCACCCCSCCVCSSCSCVCDSWGMGFDCPCEQCTSVINALYTHNALVFKK